MMPLDQLPNEILYLIFTSFGRDGSPTLYKLSLTNRTISEIARPLIHSTIHLHPLQPGGESEAARFAASYPHCCSAGAKQSLLRRTIDENPGFGHGVDVLNICFKTKHEIHRRPMFQGQAWKHFLALLKQFPKVRHLDMNCGRMNQVALLLDKDLGMRGSLEEINLLARGITPLQLFDLTCLPNLRRLIVRGSLFGRWSEDYVKPPQQNNLQSLVMAFGIKLATLREILKCSMKLKTLFFCAPLDSIRQPDLIIHGFVPQECRKRLEPFFAAAMGEVLELVNGTLERLCVQSTRAIWSASDGTRLDLSSFRALRVVSLTAWCLFEPLSTERRRRGGIFKLLPRSLENFYVSPAISFSLSVPSLCSKSKILPLEILTLIVTFSSKYWNLL